MKINDLYKSILSLANLKADSDGAISIVYGDDSVPMTQKGKRWVLPTTNQLKESDWSNRVVFHPLSENIMRPGESDIMQRYRKSINTRINYVLTCVMEDLMVLATSTKLHKNLTPDQTELLHVLKDADERTLESLKTIIKNSQDDDKNEGIIHLFLKKNGVVNTVKYSRACIVSFPLWDALATNSKSIYGATLRVKDKESIKALLKYIFPQIDEPGAYNRGSNSDIAPYLDALMASLKKIAGSLNDLIEMFYKHLSNANEYKFDCEWVEVFDNLNQMLPEIRLIPMQAGNEGNLEPKVVPPQAQPLVTPTPQAVMSPQQQQFAQAPQPSPGLVRSTGGLDFNATMNAINPQMANQGMYGFQQQRSVFNSPPSWGMVYNQPMQMGYGQPMPQQPYGNQYGQQMYQQPLPYGPSGIV